VGQLAQTGPQTRREYLAFYVGHELSDYVWYAFVGVLIVVARAWYNWLVGICGAAMAVLALWFLYNGIRLLRQERK
jgi:threonine/homoserine/homoserine lactone efflux protein